jgi:hypothetical protein
MSKVEYTTKNSIQCLVPVKPAQQHLVLRSYGRASIHTDVWLAKSAEP